MSRLLVFGGFADDTQRVLATIERLVPVGIERFVYLRFHAAKLRVAAFANTKIGLSPNDSQFALRHEDSLAPNACANETAPVPPQPSIGVWQIRLGRLDECGIERRSSAFGSEKPHPVRSGPREILGRTTCLLQSVYADPQLRSNRT